MATDFQTLLSLPNDPCYLNQPPGIQRAIRLAILQDIANQLSPSTPTDFQSLLSATNVPCYLNLPPELQEKVKLALLQLISQNIGTGGGPTPPSGPPSQGTLVEWLQANTQSVVTLCTWVATTGQNATGSGNQCATLNQNVQNGLPAVTFDGANNVLAVTLGSSLNQPYTIAIAFKYLGSLSTNAVFFGSSGGFDIEAQASGQWDISAGTSQLIGASDNSFHILFIVFNSASSEYAFDGAALTTTDFGTNPTGTTLYIGAGNTSPLFPSNVDLMEVLVWSGDGTSFYTQAYQYLFNKWG